MKDRATCEHANTKTFEQPHVGVVRQRVCLDCASSWVQLEAAIEFIVLDIEIPPPAGTVFDIDSGRTLTEAEVQEHDAQPVPAPQCDCEGECGRHEGTRCVCLAVHEGNGVRTCAECAEY